MAHQGFAYLKATLCSSIKISDRQYTESDRFLRSSLLPQFFVAEYDSITTGIRFLIAPSVNPTLFVVSIYFASFRFAQILTFLAIAILTISYGFPPSLIVYLTRATPKSETVLIPVYRTDMITRIPCLRIIVKSIVASGVFEYASARTLAFFTAAPGR